MSGLLIIIPIAQFIIGGYQLIYGLVAIIEKLVTRRKPPKSLLIYMTIVVAYFSILYLLHVLDTIFPDEGFDGIIGALIFMAWGIAIYWWMFYKEWFKKI